jgi:predicted cupin superfamily sugar epimerase
MRADKLKVELKSRFNSLDIKKSVKEIFESAIEKLESCPEGEELSSAKIMELLCFWKIPTREAGYFLEFINTNSGPLSETEANYSEIYYLMQGKQVSCFHSLTTTETWRWIGGSDVILYVITEDKVESITLNAENLEYTIEKGMLFGAKNANQANESFSLVTCKCKPGFRMEHYNDPSPEKLRSLSERFSSFRDVITELTPCDEEVVAPLPKKQFFKQLSYGDANNKDKEDAAIGIVKPKHSCLIL